MKILKSNDIKKLEARAEIGLQRLMRNAGAAVAYYAKKLAEAPSAVAVICGRGNNGGDGFVCALSLWDDGYDVIVILAEGEPKSDLAVIEYRKLFGKVRVADFAARPEAAEVVLRQADVIIDAMYGIGFSGRLSGNSLKITELCNSLSSKKIAVDIPSGAECDTAKVGNTAFTADKTITFTAHKPATASYPAHGFCGEVVVENIGISEAEIAAIDSRIMLTDRGFIKRKLPALKPDSHKGTRGKLTMLCGSYGMAGALIMSAKAALRSGVGYLNIVTDRRTYPLVAAAVPEAVFTVLDFDDSRSYAKLRLLIESSTACLMGCGLGEDLAEKVCGAVIDCCEVPLVIDADGLNFISRHKEKIRELKCSAVFTPHPGEMERLSGKETAEIQTTRLSVAEAYAHENKVVLALKGAGTVVTTGGKTALNPTGNAGLARAGSGDVLAGIIASLAAQGMEAFDAAAAGVYIHGAAADICAEWFSQRSMLPTDILEALPEVFLNE